MRFWGLNKIRHRLLHNPVLTDITVYIRTKCQVIFCLSPENHRRMIPASILHSSIPFTNYSIYVYWVDCKIAIK
jgi:hypothetical protein